MRSILFLVAVLSTAATATATAKGVNAGGDNLFWIVITIGLTLLFAMKGMLRALMTNPLMLLLLIAGLVVAYILFSALTIVYGVGDLIDSGIQKTVDLIGGV